MVIPDIFWTFGVETGEHMGTEILSLSFTIISNTNNEKTYLGSRASLWFV